MTRGGGGGATHLLCTTWWVEHLSRKRELWAHFPSPAEEGYEQVPAASSQMPQPR